MSRRPIRPDPWDDEEDEAATQAFKPLTREEATALRAQHPPVSPWRVVAVQAAVGMVVALVALIVTGRGVVVASALYGAAAVVIPAALMARGMSTRSSGANPGGLYVRFMLWELVKIVVSVVMLVLANRIVQPLSWWAMLAGFVACTKVYWLAPLWLRSRRVQGSETLRKR